MGRIIAGIAKGARLAAPKGDATRPTTDRVKEALFSTLASWFGTVEEPAGQHFEGIAVLDLFSGSGALALESASRGASRVVAVDHRTGSLIKDNAMGTRLAVTVVTAKAESAVSQLSGHGTFDLVLIDPPYDVPADAVDHLLAHLVDAGVLAERALVVVERSTRSQAPGWPAVFTETWDRGYGETTLHYGALPSEEEA